MSRLFRDKRNFCFLFTSLITTVNLPKADTYRTGKFPHFREVAAEFLNIHHGYLSLVPTTENNLFLRIILKLILRIKLISLVGTEKKYSHGTYSYQ